MDPKWTPNGPKMGPKWTPNGPQMDPKNRPRRFSLSKSFSNMELRKTCAPTPSIESTVVAGLVSVANRTAWPTQNGPTRWPTHERTRSLTHTQAKITRILTLCSPKSSRLFVVNFEETSRRTAVRAKKCVQLPLHAFALLHWRWWQT